MTKTFLLQIIAAPLEIISEITQTSSHVAESLTCYQRLWRQSKRTVSMETIPNPTVTAASWCRGGVCQPTQSLPEPPSFSIGGNHGQQEKPTALFPVPEFDGGLMLFQKTPREALFLQRVQTDFTSYLVISRLISHLTAEPGQG